MNKFYVLISLCLVAPLIAGYGKGGAGPSGDRATDTRNVVEERVKADVCPACGNAASENSRAYCMVQQGKHHVKCGHWVCGKCQDKMQSDAFYTMKKKHSIKCPVCDKEVTGFVDAYGRPYDANAAAGYAGF